VRLWTTPARGIIFFTLIIKRSEGHKTWGNIIHFVSVIYVIIGLFYGCSWSFLKAVCGKNQVFSS